ncbi:MAG: endonuclease/exonuclease/phosphatase family protein [Paracoccaceae bacterium]
MSRDGPGLLVRDILKGDPQVEAWIAVVHTVNPDVLVIGDLDFDLTGVALGLLADRLEDYPHRFTARPNRGRDSGRDLDGDGRLGTPKDAEGYAIFAGQGGMAVLSRLPLLTDAVRDHSHTRWADLPDAMTVGDGRDPTFLSTTVHWDLPVAHAPGQPLHLLIWHATAPVFDGPEDRNGRRNHDETRFWQLYLDGKMGTPPDAPFVILGTANADPWDGESRPEALEALLAHPKLHDPRPESMGAVRAAARDGGVNKRQTGPAALDTVNWPDAPGDPGNLRVDYVLPSADLIVRDAGVYWPAPEDPMAEVAARASRHRLVWLDIEMRDGRTNGG